MKTLVTGGTGFLGRKLVARLLAEGREVIVLARTPAPDLQAQGVRFVSASLDEPRAVRDACAGVETVFHVAARVGVWGRYDNFFRTNVLGTRALLEGCRQHGVKRCVYTSTPSVVYNGRDLSGANETLPLTTHCPSPYPLTKAIAERDVLAAHSPTFATIALRPHLIWGENDPHLVPRVLAKARAGRLRMIGSGNNRVDMVHVENVVDAHLLAESVLRAESQSGHSAANAISPPVAPLDASGAISAPRRNAGGRAFFITNDEPVLLWNWINALLEALGEPPVTRRISLRSALVAGSLCEAAWRVLNLGGEPPLTRFVAAELAKDHWFDLTAAKRDLGYVPRISMADGTARLIASINATRA